MQLCWLLLPWLPEQRAIYPLGRVNKLKMKCSSNWKRIITALRFPCLSEFCWALIPQLSLRRVIFKVSIPTPGMGTTSHLHSKDLMCVSEGDPMPVSRAWGIWSIQSKQRFMIKKRELTVRLHYHEINLHNGVWDHPQGVYSAVKAIWLYIILLNACNLLNQLINSHEILIWDFTTASYNRMLKQTDLNNFFRNEIL